MTILHTTVGTLITLFVRDELLNSYHSLITHPHQSKLVTP
jgi:hypothetical protein